MINHIACRINYFIYTRTLGPNIIYNFYLLIDIARISKFYFLDIAKAELNFCSAITSSLQLKFSCLGKNRKSNPVRTDGDCIQTHKRKMLADIRRLQPIRNDRD